MQMKTILTVLSSLAALFAVGYAQGFEDLGSFQTPSGNTFCIATRDTRNNTAYLQCELKENTAKILAQPKDCNLDWGNRFGLGMRGKAERECHGDTIQNPNYKKLEYGKSWQVTGFKCDLNKVRLRCMNLDKHGFEIAKAKQILF
jgi:hypothetical protein